MPEYIEREALLKALEEAHCDCEFIPIIRNIPAAADVVKVVRCRECKWNKRYLACDGSHPNRCMHDGKLYATVCLPDDFYCFYGERRNDNAGSKAD